VPGAKIDSSGCARVDPDPDRDRVPADGDRSGETGDAPCPDGVTRDCDDNCPTVWNPQQRDSDEDGIGDECDADVDGDGTPDDDDNCERRANPDQVDGDADGLGDACDRCPGTVPGARIDRRGCARAGAVCVMVRKPVISVGKLDTPPGDDRLTVKGEMVLPVPFTPPLDPVMNGARIVIDDAVGTPLDLRIPGGALRRDVGIGWKVNRVVPPTKWTFVDKSASPPAGIRKVVLEDKSTRVPGLVAFTVKGKNADYTVYGANPPLSAVIDLDPVGDCGELTFPGGAEPACALGKSGRAFKCR
jgi:hypothetical protein